MGSQKPTGSQTQSSTLDPWMNWFRGQSGNAAIDWSKSQVPGADPLTGQATRGFQNASNAGNVGLQALSGDQGAYNQLANPYQQNVLDAMNNNWGRLSSNVTNSINDQATQSGAFGGSRHGVAEGVGLGNLAQDQAQQMAALQLGGYNSTMNQANNLAGYGQAANSSLAGLGEYLRQVAIQQDPNFHKYDVLNSAMRGMPYGQTQTATSSTDLGSKILGSVLGLGGIGAGAFGGKGGGGSGQGGLPISGAGGFGG